MGRFGEELPESQIVDAMIAGVKVLLILKRLDDEPMN